MSVCQSYLMRQLSAGVPPPRLPAAVHRVRHTPATPLTHVVVVFLLAIFGEGADVGVGQRQTEVARSGAGTIQLQNGVDRTNRRLATVPTLRRRKRLLARMVVVLVVRRRHRRRQRRGQRRRRTRRQTRHGSVHSYWPSNVPFCIVHFCITYLLYSFKLSFDLSSVKCFELV